MSLRTKSVSAACAAVLAAGTVLAGTGAASAAAPNRQATPGYGVRYAATRPAAASQVRASAVTPNSTPPNSWCQGQGPNYYGWFGIAPGSTADGGVASDLWWDAKGDASPAQMQIYTGNGGANQQWCEESLGEGVFAFFSEYAIGKQCLTVQDGLNKGYQAGLRVYADACTYPLLDNTVTTDQYWYVCPRSGNSVSLEPAAATPSTAWLDVWGGSSDNGKSAFAAMNPLQIWSGNGQDNQRFTIFNSPGESGLVYHYTSGVAGC